jgi:sugar lactone lactonase YvrE
MTTTTTTKQPRSSRYAPQRKGLRIPAKGRALITLAALVLCAITSTQRVEAGIVLTTTDVGAGSLRQAIADAVPSETITFDAALSGQTIALGGSELLINADLTIDASALADGITISGNNASRVFNVTSGIVIIDSLTISDGLTTGRGGAISSNGTITIKNSTIRDNTAGDIGGAIVNFGILTLQNSTVADNTADGTSGQAFGGGIFSFATLNLVNSTIVGNTALTISGGVRAQNGTVTIENSIIAGNTSPSATDLSISGSPTFTILGTNLIGDNSSVTTTFPAGSPNINGDLVGTPGAEIDPLLAPLGNFGGPTDTMPPQLLSPARDAAGALDPGGTDQRGAPRFANGALDIGAVEANYDLVVTTNADSGPDSLREAIETAIPGSAITFGAALEGATIGLDGIPLVVTRDLTIDASGLSSGLTLDGNGASGVLQIQSSVVTLDSLTITGGIESSSCFGGGILNDSGAVTVLNSTIVGNHAICFGGGIGNNAGVVTLRNSTITGNTSDSGGGLWTNSGSFLIENSTIAGNDATSVGGGLWLESGNLDLENSIVAGNTALQDNDLSKGVLPLNLTNLGNNLIGDNTSVTTEFPADGVFVGGDGFPLTDPILAPLADNGGPTETMMLLPGSPALDAGGSTALLTDQRGFERILGTGLDIGAYEAAAGSYTPDGLTLQAIIDSGLTGPGVEFEISSDPNFLVSVRTLAGTGSPDSSDGARLAASFSFPSGVAEDSFGNLFIADTGNNTIRMMSPDGTVSTIAGTGVFGFSNGPGTTARFAFPGAIAIDSDDNIYVTDIFNHAIRMLTRPTVAGLPWIVSTIAGDGVAGYADETGSNARFNQPRGLILDEEDHILVADAGNHCIRKVTPSGAVTTFSGTGSPGATNGAAALAEFNAPFGVALDNAHNLYVADRGNHRIRKIDGTGMVTTLAGGTQGFTDGTGSAAQFNAPIALTIDQDNNLLYVADEFNHAIRKVTTLGPNGVVETVAGLGSSGMANGNSAVALFHCPTGLLFDQNGNLVVVDTQNHLLRRIQFDSTTVTASVNGDNVNAVLDAQALGLTPGTTYYFRWLLADDTRQMSGQSFYFMPSTPSMPFMTWQTAEFSSDASNPIIAGPLADPSGDGVVNLMKYGLLLDPNLSSRAGLPIQEVIGGDLTFTYTKNLAATDLTFTAETSTDLLNWTTSGVSEQILSDDGTSQQIRASVSITSPAPGFLRLVISFQ